MPELAKVTHGEIADAIENVKAQIEDLTDLARDLIKTVDALKTEIGHAAEDGKTGTGLTGRLIRLESQLRDYERIKQRVIGFVMAATLTFTAMWFLIKAKVAALFQSAP